MLCRLKVENQQRTKKSSSMTIGSGRIKDSRASWIFLAITGCVMAYTAGPFDSYGIIVVVFVEHFHETNTKIGWVGSLMVSLACFSYPFAVSLQHRFGFRAIAITSAVLITFSYITTPLVPSANYLFLTYCIPQGLGVGFMDCLSLTILPEFFDKYIGLATGIRLACVATGSMICNYLIPILIESLGWKNTFYCFSSIGAALLLYAFSYETKSTIPTNCEVISAKESDIMAANDVVQPTTKGSEFLRDRGFQLILIGCVPFFFSIVVPLMFMVQYAKSLGYPLSQCKWLAVARALASLFGRLTVGLIGDFISRRKLITHLASTVVTIFGLASALCTLTQYLPLIILYMGVVGFLEGMFWVILPLMIYELTGGVNADYVFSLVIVLVAMGFLTGPSSMGKVFDDTGDFRNVLYIICVCSLLAGAIMALGIYVRSKCSDERQFTKLNMCFPNILKLKSHNIGQKEIIPEIEKEPIAQYETAV